MTQSIKISVVACLFVILSIVPKTSAADVIASMEQISPNPTVYGLVSDFYPFIYTGVGEVTANLQYVGFGGDSSDYIGFWTGNIALIERGSYTFQEKVAAAYAAGAVGALVFDWSDQDDAILGTLLSQADIPALFITRDVGLELLGLTSGEVAVHIVTNTSFPPPIPTPEPSTLLLLGSGMAGLVGYGRRRLKFGRSKDFY